jgi:hypothetical protein
MKILVCVVVLSLLAVSKCQPGVSFPATEHLNCVARQFSENQTIAAAVATECLANGVDLTDVSIRN